MDIPKHQFPIKSLIFLKSNSQAKMAPDTGAFLCAQGAAAIYTEGDQGAWAALRKISIRTTTWLNWLYPL